MRRTIGAAALVVALTTVAAGCSTGDDRKDAAGTTTSDPSQGGPSTTGPLGSGTSPIRDGIRIEILSSQPDRVSGDDARIRVSPVAGGRTGDLKLELGDADVTGSLQATDGSLEGVVHGFVEGNNTLTATDGSHTVIQRVRAWPLTGPIISGPHLPLLACATEPAGLGPALDRDCTASARVTWSYLDQAGALHDLPTTDQEPADLGRAEIGGKDVPLYVRHERGVINRATYEITTIDPTPGDASAEGPGWNRKVVYRFGGECGATYGQGALPTSAANTGYLTKGYAIATSSLNDFGAMCNDVLSAETAMMVKERVIEQLGVPAFTIGVGSRGGAAQLHLLAQNYPGIVNGVVAVDPLPDQLTVWTGATDCGLLAHYFQGAGRSLTPTQRQAIEGLASGQTCGRWVSGLGSTVSPSTGCDPEVPAAQVYDAATNRGGVRCTLQDANRNQLGIDEVTGWANRPLDNVGLQYGLGALNSGAISFDQFLALNRGIGGYDIDGTITSDREAADPEAVMLTYEAGRVSMGGGDQLSIPIIDVDLFDDATGATADRLRAFSLRERLTRGGDPTAAPGFQIWTRLPGADPEPEAVAVVDEWLAALEEDRGGGPLDEVLQRTRPDEAVDNCLPSGATKPVRGADVYDEGPCADAYPVGSDPRIVAGAPLSNEVLKCSLKAVDPSDYEVDFTADQFDELLATFPEGVCDWSSPAVGEVVPANPDRSYEDAESPGQDA